MDFKAKGTLKYLYATADARTGTGQNGQWTVQPLLFETTGQYPKKVLVDCWNDVLGQFTAAASGSLWDMECFPEAREYNGKWYSGLRAWKANPMSSEGAGSQHQANNAPSQEPNPSAASAAAPPAAVAEDDLPF